MCPASWFPASPRRTTPSPEAIASDRPEWTEAAADDCRRAPQAPSARSAGPNSNRRQTTSRPTGGRRRPRRSTTTAPAAAIVPSACPSSEGSPAGSNQLLIPGAAGQGLDPDQLGTAGWRRELFLNWPVIRAVLKQSHAARPDHGVRDSHAELSRWARVRRQSYFDIRQGPALRRRKSSLQGST